MIILDHFFAKYVLSSGASSANIELGAVGCLVGGRSDKTVILAGRSRAACFSTGLGGAGLAHCCAILLGHLGTEIYR